MSGNGRSLVIGHGLVELDDLLNVHDSIGVEEVELTLPEDLREVGEELREDLSDSGGLMLHSVNQIVNVLSSSEGV